MDLLVSVKDYAWIISLCSVLLVFIGWNVVYKNAKRMATRSESKTAIDNLIKIINEVSDVSIAYWLSGGKTHQNVQHYIMVIMSKIAQSYEFIKVLKRRGVEIDDSFLDDISNYATLNCEVVDTLSMSEQAIHSQLSLNAAMNLITHAFEVFDMKYPPIGETQTLEEFMSELHDAPKGLPAP
ncbi:MAG: hypothetical protein LKK36_14985 [Ewingella americana]|jgi:hypothetical protein|uniref:hypothetical protein n=1 Tax=Ewingella americana TaxID=41202 RepID=UPI00242A4A6B|nr:hypothetical protein [Ewingella americana]MCI1678992.1 hypothetical protein [Ewingella americana]MCI1852364.1 hypothetical protein [Ewingella americana]MCI1862766.1 hypothetical protein [Ewingella americana]MCI2141814.1 hypothetical protein [Ewingella americana]MCI2164976.1 hypothetical protein [Ewingella americana]